VIGTIFFTIRGLALAARIVAGLLAPSRRSRARHPRLGDLFA
jgi:hypothetical protein